jgi:hypothetical protein
MMRIIFIAFVLLSSFGAADAQVLKRIDITEYGLYTSKTDRSIAAPGTALGTESLVSDIRHLESTTTVPGRIDVQFGIRYRLVGSDGASIRLKKVWIIPAPGLHNPDTGNTTMTEVVYLDRKIGAVHFAGFTFEHSWEIVPGVWTLELWEGDRKLASQGFLIARP